MVLAILRPDILLKIKHILKIKINLIRASQITILELNYKAFLSN